MGASGATGEPYLAPPRRYATRITVQVGRSEAGAADAVVTDLEPGLVGARVGDVAVPGQPTPRPCYNIGLEHEIRLPSSFCATMRRRFTVALQNL